MKRVNTANPLFMADEDRKSWRSDMGNKMTKQLHTKTTAKEPTKKDRLLSHPDIKRWYNNTARGSSLTADMRLRRVSRFCEVNKTTPIQFAELGLKNIRAVTDLIQDHMSWMEEQKHSPGYIDSTLTALKSWLYQFDIEIKRKIKIRYADSTPTLEGERVPDRDEITEIFNRASFRTSAVTSLVSKAGLRLQVLGNHDATDGLTLADMPDIEIQGKTAVSLRSPCMIIVRRTLSKARHQYYTFLTENGTRKLVAYFNERIARGEMLGPESAVIAPNTNYKVYRGNNVGKKFLPTRKISDDIRKTFRPRFAWRPHVLRAYFDTQLLMAESRGKIAHDFRVFFMGHKGSMEAKYTTNKGMLPLALVEEMRQAFKRSEELLDLELQTENTSQEQVYQESQTTNSTQQQIQMVCAIERTEELMSQGWKFVATIPNGKAVFEKFGVRMGPASVHR